MTKKYADIIVDISHEKLDRTFQYLVPEEMQEILTEGMVVTIPFGRGDRQIKGYVTGFDDKPSFDVSKMKRIIRANSNEETVESKLVALAAWMRQNYGSTMIQALKTVLPVKDKVKGKEARKVCLRISKADGARLLDEYLNKHYVAKARLLAGLLDQAELPYQVVTAKLQVTANVIRSLEKDGILEITTESVYRDALEEVTDTKCDILTKEQTQVVNGILEEWEADDRPCLIHGITGSGKTQVYMELIQETVDQGRQVIVLIPEIALTHQIVMRFLHRFGKGVSFLNSRMSTAQRYDQFKAAKAGDVQIMVGPRSALFTPFPDLGLIIMDEEHETSYHSETVPRYHAREVAVRRGEMEQAHVVMGSATPSVTAYYHAMEGDYRLFRLRERYGSSQLPKTTIIDMREELKAGNRSIFSRSLQEAIALRLEKKEQVMLFLNRRGYAGFVSCRSCGYVAKCPHCDVSLSSHRNGKLICHYCGYETPDLKECPECQSTYIGGFGAGTQQIESLVLQMFPGVRVLRMDLDTTRGKDGHAKILTAFENGEADILIGTQMIVKGHDFPHVTLVGVLAADLSLHAADYCAGERTFQLVCQAVGRAGRGEQAGEAFIQTYDPEHPALVAAADQDYEAFYDEEIAYRTLMGYPPVDAMMAILGSGMLEEHLEQAMEYLKKYLQQIYRKPDLQIIGPAPESIGKINDRYRKVIYCKHPKYDILTMIKDQLERYIQINSGYDSIQIQFDMT
ncbi:MAG: primosomal protein N' [Lachnospiraceae bacterium]|nr:primosomal protein N' [Lachnospiraceae bacterium]